MASKSLTRAPARPKTTPALPGEIVGYCRVSTTGQTVAAQVAGLTAAGCTTIFQEIASGADRDRPELEKAMAYLKPGMNLIVPALDRIARGLSHLLELVEVIKSQGATFKEHPRGGNRHVQHQRKLLVRAAMAAGKLIGAPAVRDRKTRGAEIKKMTAAHSAKLAAGSSAWLPTLLAMRPAAPWLDVCAVLAQAGSMWSEERLRRAARRCVRQGLAPAAWSPCSVQMLLDRTVACGLLPESRDDERIAA